MKGALRELAARAHEEDLRRAMLPVSAAFDRWKARDLESGDLAQIIHEFHDGPARKLYKLYNGDHRWAVAYAIANGILSVDVVPADVLEYCRPAIEHLAEQGEE